MLDDPYEKVVEDLAKLREMDISYNDISILYKWEISAEQLRKMHIGICKVTKGLLEKCSRIKFNYSMDLLRELDKTKMTWGKNRIYKEDRV